MNLNFIFKSQSINDKIKRVCFLDHSLVNSEIRPILCQAASETRVMRNKMEIVLLMKVQVYRFGSKQNNTWIIKKLRRKIELSQSIIEASITQLQL